MKFSWRNRGRRLRKIKSSIKRRYFGVSNFAFHGGVHASADPSQRFHVELIDGEGRVCGSTIADDPSRKDEIPDGYGFSLPIPLKWLVADGAERVFQFRVVETGQVFPAKPRLVPVEKLLRQLRRAEKSGARLGSKIKAIQSELVGKLAPRTIVVGTHEMTRTGAPMIILEVVRHLTSRHDCRVIALSLDSEGSLEDAFREESDLVVPNFDQYLRWAKTEAQEFLANIANSQDRPIALINSLCSTELANACDEAGFAVTTLIHEYPYAFERDWVLRHVAAAEAVVFPCRDVYERFQAEQLIAASESDTRFFIQPQGCYQREMPEVEPAERQAFVDEFRRENHLRPADRVVMACGTIDSRKGFDWFANLIRHYGTNSPNAFTTHFVWVGTIRNEDLFQHAIHDMKREGVIGHFHHLDEIEDVRLALGEADLFLLCSRIDPFPSVVLEAFLAGVPVIAFDRDQGVAEMIRETGFGKVVPYQDSVTTTLAIDDLLAKDEKRLGLGDAGAAFVAEHFPFSNYADRLAGWIFDKEPLSIPGEEKGSEGGVPSKDEKKIAKPHTPAAGGCPIHQGEGPTISGHSEMGLASDRQSQLRKTQAALNRGMDFLAKNQREDGEFSTLIWFDEDPDKAVFDSSPFATSLIAHSLGHCPPRARPMIGRALDFLEEQMEPEGVWRYYTSKQFKHQRIPPDLDDTSCVSLVLTRNDREIPDNGWIFEENCGEEGLFYTWLLSSHSTSPAWKAYLASLETLAEFRSPPKPAEFLGITRFNVAKDEVPEREVDATVIANVVAYLGETDSTAKAIDYLVDLIQSNREEGTSFYYVDVVSLYYMIARACDCGVKRFRDLGHPITERIEKRLADSESAESPLNLAMAACALLTFSPDSPLLSKAIDRLVASQSEDGAWPRSAFYSGPPVSPRWGSEELTTGFAVEALSRYLQLQGAGAFGQGYDELDLSEDGKSIELNLLQRDFLVDPYPVLQQLRENFPVIYNRASDTWMVTRYRDVVQVLQQPVVYSSRANSFESILMGSDGPDHERVHALVKELFSPRHLADLETKIREWASADIEAFRAKGRCEFFSEMAATLPMKVITHLLGAPQSSVPTFMDWGDLFVRLSVNRKKDAPSPDEFAVLEECRAYFQKHVDNEMRSRSQAPFAELVHPRDPAHALSEPDLVDLAQLLMSAGSATTINLLAIALHRLASDPVLAKTLRESPRDIPRFIEELLRFEPPFQDVFRITVAPSILGGQEIPAGQYIQLMVGSANRDEEVFPDADQFILDRKPNRHLSFGSGAHACVGMAVSRLEAKIVIEMLLEAFEEIRLDDQDGPVVIETEHTLRRPKKLPLILLPATR